MSTETTEHEHEEKPVVNKAAVAIVSILILLVSAGLVALLAVFAPKAEEKEEVEVLVRVEVIAPEPRERAVSVAAQGKVEARTVTQERIAKSLPYSWEPAKWYTLKFKVSNEGDKAVLRGKVWPKGTAEPSDWMVEASDSIPVRTGSPGLFGNAKDAEIWLDNISVTPN